KDNRSHLSPSFSLSSRSHAAGSGGDAGGVWWWGQAAGWWAEPDSVDEVAFCESQPSGGCGFYPRHVIHQRSKTQPALWGADPTPPVWRKFNNVSHGNLKSKYEFRHCPVGNIVILFANLSSHSHLSWGQITCLGLICRRIGRNRIVVQRLSFRSLPYGNAKSGPLRFSTKSTYCSRPRVSKVKKIAAMRLTKGLEINPLLD